MQRVAILALPGVLDASFALLLEVLSAANHVKQARRRRPAFAVKIWTLAGRRVQTSLGAAYRADGSLRQLAGFPTILVVPGQNEMDPRELIASAEAVRSKPLLELLRSAHARGALVAANCSGVFYLAASGLLDGRAATTAWFLADALSRAYPKVRVQPERALSRDGNIWTAGAALSMIDLALALVWRFAGARVEREVARYLALEKHPTQARYMMTTHFAALHPDVSRVEAWVRARLSDEVRIEALAQAVGLSARTLSRRIHDSVGLSPSRFVQRIRAEEAVHLLETTQNSVEDVARQVGYDGASTLRRVLRREIGLTPREIRGSRST